jgi:hypothetical protein
MAVAQVWVQGLEQELVPGSVLAQVLAQVLVPGSVLAQVLVLAQG